MKKNSRSLTDVGLMSGRDSHDDPFEKEVSILNFFVYLDLRIMRSTNVGLGSVYSSFDVNTRIVTQSYRISF